MSPVLALLALIAGLVLAVFVLATLFATSLRGRRVGLVTTMGVILAVMVVPVPAAVRDRVNGARTQGQAYRLYDEQTAHRKCLLDSSRPELVGMVDFIRVYTPPNAEFRLRPPSGVTACLAFNLLPRRPVAPTVFDAQRHWIIYDRHIPAGARAELRAERSLPEAQRRYVEFQPGLVLARPISEVRR